MRRTDQMCTSVPDGGNCLRTVKTKNVDNFLSIIGKVYRLWLKSLNEGFFKTLKTALTNIGYGKSCWQPL